MSEVRGNVMFEVYRKEITWGGKLLTFETGKIARQADGAIMVTYGGTTVPVSYTHLTLPTTPYV